MSLYAQVDFLILIELIYLWYIGPFSYLATGFVFGVGVWYYDYWRRKAVQEIMYEEERKNYHFTLRALNKVRIGEEEEIGNLVDYLANTTVKEW